LPVNGRRERGSKRHHTATACPGQGRGWTARFLFRTGMA
jgi:hypothetical protein